MSTHQDILDDEIDLIVMKKEDFAHAQSAAWPYNDTFWPLIVNVYRKREYTCLLSRQRLARVLAYRSETRVE